ncbi:MAG: hypothetical protein KBD73_03085 [Candidatus Magasanikbacteria bacterium]|nr:hypothetical protein [Candidatus Magasanikbacteria bacterium]
MDSLFKERMVAWKEKVGGVFVDHWMRLIMFWIMFDAYLSANAPIEARREIEKRNWFYDNPNELKTILEKLWALPDYQHLLGILKKESPVYSTNPSNLGVAKELNDTSNTREIVEFVYQIRCNLFHGGKDLRRERDNRLTKVSEQLFDQAFAEFLK